MVTLPSNNFQPKGDIKLNKCLNDYSKMSPTTFKTQYKTPQSRCCPYSCNTHSYAWVGMEVARHYTFLYDPVVFETCKSGKALATIGPHLLYLTKVCKLCSWRLWHITLEYYSGWAPTALLSVNT